jgi:recombinational DNA repair protein (RecF pathway)
MHTKDEKPITCAFCGVRGDECDTLVSSEFSEERGTYICADCVNTCVDAIVTDSSYQLNVTYH